MAIYYSKGYNIQLKQVTDKVLMEWLADYEAPDLTGKETTPELKATEVEYLISGKMSQPIRNDGCGPCGPVSPSAPVAPFSPWAPVSPFGRCGPFGPVMPVAPERSVMYVYPLAPFT